MNSKKKVMYKLNPVIFWPILIIMVAIIALSFINQNGFASVVSAALNAEVINFKWIVGPITLFMFITMAAMIFLPWEKSNWVDQMQNLSSEHFHTGGCVSVQRLQLVLCFTE